MGFVRCLARAAMALHLLGGFLSKFLYLAEYATKNQLRSRDWALLQVIDAAAIQNEYSRGHAGGGAGEIPARQYA